MLEAEHLSIKNNTNLSLKYSMLKMSLMHTLQLEITNISLKSKKISVQLSYIVTTSIFDQIESTNLSLKNSTNLRLKQSRVHT